MTMLHESDTQSPAQDTTAGHDAPRLHHGLVRAVQAGRIFVVCADTAFYARVAASCLLQPQIGDHVLVSAIGQESHVLAVLERADPSRAVMQIEGDVALQIQRGGLHVQAATGMSLEAGQSLRLRAQAAALEATTMALRAEHLVTQAQAMLSHAEQRVDVAQYRRDVATRMHADYGDSVRRVSGHDEQSARSSRIVVEREWRVRAERSDILARKRVKIDAAQVDLG